MKTNTKKWLVALGERGLDYPAKTKIIKHRRDLYILPPGDDMAQVVNLPLPMCAEVQEDVEIENSPFNPSWNPGDYIPKTCTEPTEIITNMKTFARISKMDSGYVGTENYMGLAYFWSHEYRHTLRDCNAASRVAVHAAWLANDLPLDGVSSRHAEIMRAALKQCAEAIKLNE